MLVDTFLVLGALGSSVSRLLAWAVADYLEAGSYWTLWFRLSLIEPFTSAVWATACLLCLTHSIFEFSPNTVMTEYVNLGASTISYCCQTVSFACTMIGAGWIYRYLLNYRYLILRWQAWSGPSRTGIPSGVKKFLGDTKQWRALVQMGSDLNCHPIDRYSGSFWKDDGIFWDPTDILRAASLRHEKPQILSEPDTLAVEKTGVYQPHEPEISVSLLWGEHNGFQRRCSRGIMSVPRFLLASSPRLKNGLSARPLCLAFGILSRNKGLYPHSLICNLGVKKSYQSWEEGGLWPHPSKTLRSIYYKEFKKSFLLLGDSYVEAATELALLLADTSYSSIGTWLDLRLEHQDLDLNKRAHAMGASSIDLDRLYRGHYAAMLISLNVGPGIKGPLIRPELKIFDATCRLDKAAVPSWALTREMEERRKAELDSYGPILDQLILAII